MYAAAFQVYIFKDMKRVYIYTALSFLLGAPLLAQNQIGTTSPSLMHRVGLHSTRNIAAAIPRIDTGANQTWDITLRPYSVDLQQQRDAVESGDPFPQADYKFANIGTEFFKLGNDALYLVGHTGVANTISFIDTYTIPKKIIPFGLPFGSSTSFEWAYTHESADGAIIYYRGLDTCRVIGYGTVILNGIRYEDCIQMRVSTGVSFRVDTTRPYVRSSHQRLVKVFAPGLGEPLLTGIDDLNPRIVNYYYLYNTQTISAAAPFTGIRLSSWPQPATDVLFFKQEGASLPAIVSCRSIDGHEYQIPTDRRDAIDIKNLSPGIYMLHIPDKTGMAVHRFIKE